MSTLAERSRRCAASDDTRVAPDVRDEEVPENDHIFALDAFVRLLAPDDPIDLLAAVAGLQLMPENADRGVRLETVARVCVARKRWRKHLPVSYPRLRHICASPFLHRLKRFESPFPNPFTESFTFFGGGFIVFPGRFDETTFVLRHLAMALCLDLNPWADAQFVADVRALITAVLALSDAIAWKAGLGRGIAPEERQDRRIVVPGSKRLRELKRAVTFRRSEIVDLLAAYDVPPQTLDDLMTQIGQEALDGWELDKSALFARPIVRIDDRIIVALPGQLLDALRHAIILRARARGLADELAKRYHAAVAFAVSDSLALLDHYPVLIESEATPDIPLLTVDFHSLDIDKLVYVALLTDPLHVYHEDAVYASWDAGASALQIIEHMQAMVAFVREKVAADMELLCLLLVQGVGHAPLLTGPDDDKLLTLGMTVADLQTIAWLPDRDPLTLWKFACAAHRVRRHAAVYAVSVLDKYETYRRYGPSYGLPDPQAEGVLVLLPIGAGRLRREVVAVFDPHAVPHYQPGLVIEVLRLYGAGSPPIYGPPSSPFSAEEPIAVVVEECALPIWITSPPDAVIGDDLRMIYGELIDATAYWLSRCTATLAPILVPLTAVAQRLHLRVHLADVEVWARSWANNDAPGVAVAMVQPNQADVLLDIVALPAVQHLFVQRDNAGERALLSEILRGIRALLPDPVSLDDGHIAAIVDLHLPLSDSKRIVALDVGLATEHDPRGLPRYRPPCHADIAEQLDELAVHLKARAKFASGESRTLHLRNVVEFFYTRLEELVATLDPNGLLEQLTAQHEALVYSNATHQLQIHNPLDLRRTCATRRSEA